MDDFEDLEKETEGVEDSAEERNGWLDGWLEPCWDKMHRCASKNWPSKDQTFLSEKLNSY